MVNEESRLMDRADTIITWTARIIVVLLVVTHSLTLYITWSTQQQVIKGQIELCERLNRIVRLVALPEEECERGGELRQQPRAKRESPSP